jgi:hypothetical protein
MVANNSLQPRGAENPTQEPGVTLLLILSLPQATPKLKPAYHPVQEMGAGPGAGGGALTAISAAKNLSPVWMSANAASAC